MRFLIGCLLLIPRLVSAQPASPVADALRRTLGVTGPRVQLAAQVMPADKYSERASTADYTFGETVAMFGNYSSLYCRALTGVQDPIPGSDEVQRRDSVVVHLGAKLDF